LHTHAVVPVNTFLMYIYPDLHSKCLHWQGNSVETRSRITLNTLQYILLVITAFSNASLPGNCDKLPHVLGSLFYSAENRRLSLGGGRWENEVFILRLLHRNSRRANRKRKDISTYSLCVNSEFIFANNMRIWHRCLFASLSKVSGTDPMQVHVALLVDKVIIRQDFLRFFPVFLCKPNSTNAP
jgi:hypothetical protein